MMYARRIHENTRKSWPKSERAQLSLRSFRQVSDWMLSRCGYQGTIFLIPFFFLLLDSLPLLLVVDESGLVLESVPLAAGVEPSVALASVPVVVVVVTAFVAGSAAAGAGAGVPAAFGSPVAPGGVVPLASAG